MAQAASSIRTAPARGSAGSRAAATWKFVGVGLPLVAILAGRLSTIDLAYHLRSGELMIDSGRLLNRDVFSFTAPGSEWLNQQWGSQILLGGVFRLGGWLGLTILRGALALLVFVFLYRACRAAGSGMRRSALLTITACLMAFAGLALRPQLFGMVLFALVLLLLAQRRERPRLVWLVPPLFALWANLHGSFALGLVLIGLAWLEDLRRRRPEHLSILLVGLAASLATLVNPFGWDVWRYVTTLSTNQVITRLVSEWQPPTIRDLTGGIFLVSLILVAGLLAWAGRRVPWTGLLGLGTFALVGFFAVRGVFWWGLVAPVTLAGVFPNEGEGEQEPGARQTSGHRRPWSMDVIVRGALVVLALIFVLRWLGQEALRPSPALVNDAPVRVTSAAQEVLVPGARMFNPQLWGSWFELALPDRAVFVDSRIELYPAYIWNDYLDVSFAREGWQQILDRWNVSVVIASRDQQAALITRIRSDSGWRLVYGDADGAVFVRR